MIDSSSSISSADFENMRNALDEMANVFQFTIGRTVEIGLLQYFHRGRVIFINGKIKYVHKSFDYIIICIEILDGMEILMNIK